MVAAAVTDAWRWQPHPEVWILILGVIALAWYAVGVVGARVVPPGQPRTTRRQRVFFVLGVIVLWVASDWPVHDIGEEYLYAVHMVQHLLLTLVAPALFLLATPEWLARAILGDGTLQRVVRRLSRPVAAGLFFFAVTALSHWPTVVNLSVENGELHYLVHLFVVTSAFFMWMPVCGPIPEWRLSKPAQMLYLFIISILPTVPAGWLTFAEHPVYSAYDRPQRLWGIGVVDDQQLAGMTMKVVGGLFLWTVIATIFFRWAAQHDADERRERLAAQAENELTWRQVEAELERLGPAPTERRD